MSSHKNSPNDPREQSTSQQNEPDEIDWESFDTKLASISTYDGLVELGDKLRNFAEMVKKEEQLPELRLQLKLVLKTKPDEIKSLISLPKTSKLLAKLELEKGDEKPILNEILEARKKISVQIEKEAIKCSLTIGYAQFVNLFRAWKVIRDAKLVNSTSRKQIDDINAIFKNTILVCGETKKLTAEYTENTNQELKDKILKQLEKNYMKIREGYRECSLLLNSNEFKDLKFNVSIETLRLQFVKLEQQEGTKLNMKRFQDRFSLQMFENKWLLVKPFIFGVATGLNYGSTKFSEYARNDLIQIKEKIKQLENALFDIEETKKEVEQFLLNPKP